MSKKTVRKKTAGIATALKRGIPVLPPLPKPSKKVRQARKTAAFRLKQEHMGDANPRKFRDPARVAAVVAEREKWAEEQGIEKAELDRQIEENKRKIERMREDQDEKEKKSGSLSIDEQVLILQAHFDHGIGVKLLASQLGRNHSVVSRFLSKYKSTASLAKLHLQNSAERLARRVVRSADVDQSLEVLDRLDVLPKKERGKESGGNNFQVIVGMPGQPAGSGGLATPTRSIAPSQAAIDAAVIQSEPVDGKQGED